MALIRIIARPFVAAPFVVYGIEMLRDPAPRAEHVAPMLKALANRVSWLPSKDPETLVRMQGAISLGAGTLLALGRLQRPMLVLLAAQLTPVLLTEHRFWQEKDPVRRDAERAQLLKTAGLFGALLLAGTAARPRPTKAAREAERKTAEKIRKARRRAAELATR